MGWDKITRYRGYILIWVEYVLGEGGGSGENLRETAKKPVLADEDLGGAFRLWGIPVKLSRRKRRGVGLADTVQHSIMRNQGKTDRQNRQREREA